MTIQEFITEQGLSIETSPLPESHPNYKADMFNWLVRITKKDQATGADRGTFETSFFCGGAHIQPTKGIVARPFGDVTQRDINKARKLSNISYDFEKKAYRPFFGKIGWFEARALQQAFEPKPPTLESVLDCLAMDSTVLDAGSFEDWCAELGYDTDSREAEKIYKACIESAIGLRGFLGSRALEVLMYECERL